MRRSLISAVAVAVAALVIVVGHDVVPHEGLHQAHAAPAMQATATPTPTPETWAFEETFNGTPSAPSQSLLPTTFDYEWTQRHHMFHVDGYPDVGVANGFYGEYPASHSSTCGAPPSTHTANNSHRSDAGSPDQAFYICNNHIMSAIGNTGNKYYSIASFWPRQEFDFAGGGVLEFDTDLMAPEHVNAFWEVAIMPRDEFLVAPALWFRPWDGDRYSHNRMVLSVLGDTTNGWRRDISIGTGAIDPSGVVASATDANAWGVRYPTDYALTNATIRRKHRIEITSTQVIWKTMKDDSSWDTLTATLPSGGMPFTRALVNFKTHAVGPGNSDHTHAASAGNWESGHSKHTIHWDNIRFTGTVLPAYIAHELSPTVIDLETTRNIPNWIPISQGTTDTQTVTLTSIGSNPVLTGQTHAGSPGHILLRVNGGTTKTVIPMLWPDQADEFSGNDPDNPSYCFFGGWRQFRIPLNTNELVVGTNTIEWEVGPPTTCETVDPQWWSNGFGVKGTEIQFDGGTGTPTPTPVPGTPTNTPVPPTNTPVPPTNTPTPGPTNTPTPTNTPSTGVSLSVTDNLDTTITLAWSGVSSPTVGDWIGEYLVGDPDSTPIRWFYDSSCSVNGHGSTALASGSCPFNTPTGSGSYNYRLFSNDTFTKLATSNTLVVP